MRITLSFDNGPEPEVTPRVLDTLRAHGLPAIFFVIASKLAADRRPLAQRAKDEGHLIGNHTFTHTLSLGAFEEPAQAARREILDAQQILGDLSDPRRLFRPRGSSGGVLDDRLLSVEAIELLRSGGFTLVLWNLVPGDWLRPQDWVAPALDGAASREHSLLVLHDLPTGAMERLDAFIEAARAAGAEFSQELPADCTPIVRGEVVGDLAPYHRARPREG